MVFPLEKILTISARDYCEIHRKKLENYEVRGIHSRDIGTAGATFVLSRFLDIVPEEAEVVVDYRFSDIRASGTALIPKNR